MKVKIIKLKPINFFCRIKLKEISKTLSRDAFKALLFLGLIDPDRIGIKHSDYLFDALNLTFQRSTFILKELESGNYIEIQLQQSEQLGAVINLPYKSTEYINEETKRKNEEKLSDLAKQILEEFRIVPQDIQINNQKIRQLAKKFRQPFAKIEQALFELTQNDWAISEVRHAMALIDDVKKVENQPNLKVDVANNAEAISNNLMQKPNLTEIEAKLIGYFQALALERKSFDLDFLLIAKTFKVTQKEVAQAILSLAQQNYVSIEITKAIIHVN